MIPVNAAGLRAEIENVLAELGTPLLQKGEAGLQAREMIQLGGGAGVPRGVERAEFVEGRLARLAEPDQSESENLVQGEFFRCEKGAAERAGGGGFLLPKALHVAAQFGKLHEKIAERGRDRSRDAEPLGRGQFEEMAEAGGGFAEDGVGGVERGETGVAAAGRVGMLLRGGALKALAQGLGIQPRTARLGERGEVVGHGAGVRAGRAARGKGNFPGGARKWALPVRRGGLWTCPARLMKSATLRRALVLGMTLALFACNKPIADKNVLFGVIHENVHALEKKDVATVMATIHPESPSFAGTREAVEEMFRSVDLKYTLSDLLVESATPEEVRVSFRQKTEKLGERGEFASNIVEGIHTLRPDQGTWKIYKTLQTKVTDLNGKPLFAADAPPPASPIPPAVTLPPGAVPPAATPAPPVPPAQ